MSNNSSHEYLLKMQGISKTFPGVNALQNVDFSLRRGEVVALVGENGAGKSTLMKILTGVYRRDANGGTILFDGRPVDYTEPMESKRDGIIMIFQELSLVMDVTVAENVFLGSLPMRGKSCLVNHKELYRRCKEILQEIGCDASPKAIVRTLPIAQQQMIEIARAYLSEIFEKMGAGEVSMEFVCGPERTVEIRLGGDSIGAVIGKRGETLDSLQYLVCLVANRLRRREGDYVRFTMNAGNYREKREETLKALAARMAKKALKTGRPVALEPMNPYERRIIHAVITDIEGVTSKSTGEEPNRKVIIKPTREAPERRPRREGGRYRRDRGRRDSRERSESYERPERAPEEKEAPKEHREAVKLDDSVKLYGKIEL